MINFKERHIYEWKGEFINHMILVHNFKSYLELGVGNLDTWNIVNGVEKVGVDSNSRFQNTEIVCATTDFFFQNNNKKFDLIYIDACHEKNQVRNDFINSLKILTKGGIILFHDINPLNAAETNKNASGDVFEFWMLLSNLCETKTILGPYDDALGIFIQKENLNVEDLLGQIISNKMQSGYELFDQNRSNFVHKKII